MTSFSQNTCRALLTLAVVGAFCLPVPSHAQTKPAAAGEHSPAKKQTITGVKNFAEVTPFLYRGAQPSREGYRTLAEMGVDIIVDARLSGADAERQAVTNNGMRYVSIPWHCMFPQDKAIAQFLALLRENPNKKVFVHCRYGDDRTGMMVAAYRMAVEKWTADDAWKEMQQFGFNHTLCSRLASYAKSFPERLKQNGELHGTVPSEN
jgi:protein tyrosine/serine phosphatase